VAFALAHVCPVHQPGRESDDGPQNRNPRRVQRPRATNWPSRGGARERNADQAQAPELPWVPVEKEYEFETEAGRRLADLRGAAAPRLRHHVRPTTSRRLPRMLNRWTISTPPRCTSTRDVTPAFSARADRFCSSPTKVDGLAAPLRLDPRHRLPIRFRAALTKEQARGPPRSRDTDAPPEAARTGGSRSRRLDAPREPELDCVHPRERTVYHTYTVSAPDPPLLPPLIPARTDAEGSDAGAASVAQGRVPDLMTVTSAPAVARVRS
jgi:hypothetical protein